MGCPRQGRSRGLSVPAITSYPSDLTAALADIVERSPERTCLVVTVGGRTLFAHNPDVPVTPASTEKLVTATAALEVLGPEVRPAPL